MKNTNTIVQNGNSKMESISIAEYEKWLDNFLKEKTYASGYLKGDSTGTVFIRKAYEESEDKDMERIYKGYLDREKSEHFGIEYKKAMRTFENIFLCKKHSMANLRKAAKNLGFNTYLDKHYYYAYPGNGYFERAIYFTKNEIEKD